VAENLDLAFRRADRSLLQEVFSRSDRARSDAVDGILQIIGLASQRHALAGILSHGQKQWLEIGMVLVRQPKVVLLDEPVAGMSDEEKLVRRLRSPDRAIIVVEHDMDFVEQIADLVTVLDQGATLFEGDMKAARTDPRVLDVYIGRLTGRQF
jgi:urea transport system ATP-binding protein